MIEAPLLLMRHDVVSGVDDETDLLVLWSAPDGSSVAVVNRSRPDDMPFLLSTCRIVEMVEAGAWVVTEGLRPSPRPSHELSERDRVRRDRAHEIVRAVVDGHEPEIYVSTPRGRLVTLAMKAHGVTRPTVLQHLRRFFHGGMMRDALVPRFDRCGAPGVPRMAAPGAPKLGRPTAPGHPTGSNVTADVKRSFQLAIDVSYARRREHNLHSAYQLCVERFLSTRVEGEDGSITFEPRPEFADGGLPTLGQFLYWFRIDHEAGRIGRRREGVRKWEMKNRAVLRTATAQTLGPGMRYEIDATVLNVYVRARGRKSRLVGRPTLYVVIDVWSRMIVGVHVTLEHPSWIAASMALANAVEDKVAFCARHGIEIEEHEWPVRHLCSVLLGDKGEVARSGVEAMLLDFGVRVESASSFRADWKGIVERRFGIVQDGFAPYVDGYVLPDFRQRGATDYRDEAVLDIDEITQVVIHMVLFFNNHHELVDYPRHPGQVEDEVPSVPVELWSWGLANTTGSPRLPDVDRFRFSLLPRGRATVTPNGILFQGRYYVARSAINEGWFERARSQGQFPVEVSYDKRDVDRIYLRAKAAEHGFEVADLNLDRSREHQGLSGWESHALQVDAKRTSANRRDGQLLERAKTNDEIARINARAREGVPPRPQGAGRASERRGMREARADHVAVDRGADVIDFRPGGQVSVDDRPPATHPPGMPARSSTGVPSVADLIRSLDEEAD